MDIDCYFRPKTTKESLKNNSSFYVKKYKNSFCIINQEGKMHSRSFPTEQKANIVLKRIEDGLVFFSSIGTI